jgi:hypothetical protein
VSSGSEDEHEGADEDEDEVDEFEELPEEASYTCDSCGEEIVVPIDPTAGASQDYVEDCPVCCHPNRIRLSYESDAGFRIDSEGE